LVFCRRNVVSMKNFNLLLSEEILYFELSWFVYFHRKSENHIFGWFSYEMDGSRFYQLLMLMSYFEPFIYFYYISIDCISKLLGVRFWNNHTCVFCKKDWISQICYSFGRSFIYNIKNKGPKIEPWGMPYLMSSHFE